MRLNPGKPHEGLDKNEEPLEKKQSQASGAEDCQTTKAAFLDTAVVGFFAGECLGFLGWQRIVALGFGESFFCIG